jgi:hypothetical protein
MPTLSPEDLITLQDLAYKYRIKFIEDLPQSAWPDRYYAILDQVKALGQATFDTYTTSPREEGHGTANAKLQAINLIAAAKQCLLANEASWRSACEPLVLASLSSQAIWHATSPNTNKYMANGYTA